MTQTQTVQTREFVVTGKDYLSDSWVTRHFTDRSLAERWADARSFVLPDSGGNIIRESTPS